MTQITVLKTEINEITDQFQRATLILEQFTKKFYIMKYDSKIQLINFLETEIKAILKYLD